MEPGYYWYRGPLVDRATYGNAPALRVVYVDEDQSGWLCADERSIARPDLDLMGEKGTFTLIPPPVD
jgi:hypothetical protein